MKERYRKSPCILYQRRDFMIFHNILVFTGRNSIIIKSYPISIKKKWTPDDGYNVVVENNLSIN